MLDANKPRPPTDPYAEALAERDLLARTVERMTQVLAEVTRERDWKAQRLEEVTVERDRAEQQLEQIREEELRERLLARFRGEGR